MNNMYKKYVVKYEVILEGSDPLKDKEIKIDNCMSSFHAQVRLEEYLQKKYINFKKLIVYSCREDNPFGFEDIFQNFGDIFGNLNSDK